MPELPEVETIVNDLRAAGIIGQRITGCVIGCPFLIIGGNVAAFRNNLRGSRILDIARRGKFIVLTLSSRLFVLIHLRMTGQFDLVAAGMPKDAHQHIVLRLGARRELRYRDTRKFGRWQLTAHPAAVLGALGPEPLAASFKRADLSYRLKARHRQLKPFLLDQRIIAGLGNIYVDEALWEARLHPRRSSDSLNKPEASRLFNAIRLVLRRGIANKGTSLGKGRGNYARLDMTRGGNQNHLRVVGQKGIPCPRCGVAVQRLVVGQRSTYICPACQKP